MRYVLVKGPNLFVFTKAESSSPKYAVDLERKKATLHPVVGQKQLVTIESGLGDVDYKFLFDLRDNSDVAKNFVVTLREQIAVGETSEVKQVRAWTLSKLLLFDLIKLGLLPLILNWISPSLFLSVRNLVTAIQGVASLSCLPQQLQRRKRRTNQKYRSVLQRLWRMIHPWRIRVVLRGNGENSPDFIVN